MKRLGKVLHLSSNNNLILRAKGIAKPNQKVYNKQIQIVGKVIDVFGPVKMPFISIKPLIPKPNTYVGKILYLKR